MWLSCKIHGSCDILMYSEYSYWITSSMHIYAYQHLRKCTCSHYVLMHSVLPHTFQCSILSAFLYAFSFTSYCLMFDSVCFSTQMSAYKALRYHIATSTTDMINCSEEAWEWIYLFYTGVDILPSSAVLGLSKILSNISHTKSQNLNVSHLINSPLKPCVNLRMKM